MWLLIVCLPLFVDAQFFKFKKLKPTTPIPRAVTPLLPFNPLGQHCEPRWILFKNRCYKLVDSNHLKKNCPVNGGVVVNEPTPEEAPIIKTLTEAGNDFSRQPKKTICRKNAALEPYPSKRKLPEPTNEINCGGVDGWYGLKKTNKCYAKLFSEAPLTSDMANEECKKFGGYLTSIHNKEEHDHILRIAHDGYVSHALELPFVGLRRNKTQWYWMDGTIKSPFAYVKFHHEEDGKLLADKKQHVGTQLVSDQIAYQNNNARYQGRFGNVKTVESQIRRQRYICSVDQPTFVAKMGKAVFMKADPILDKPAEPTTTTLPDVICPSTSVRVSKRECKCKPGYTDILDTNMPDKANYERGQHCIKDTPCDSVTQEIDLMFVVDDSGSIETPDWTYVVKFLKEAIDVIPRNGHVGFVKFSSFANGFWLPSGFTDQDYLSRVPSNQDGYKTNTPAALELAGKLFKEVKSKKPVVVLITDGVPQISKYTDEEADKMTIEAAEKLQNEGVHLLVVGIGDYLAGLQDQLMNWVASPSDYFNYAQRISNLDKQHMRNILMRVCQED